MIKLLNAYVATNSETKKKTIVKLLEIMVKAHR